MYINYIYIYRPRCLPRDAFPELSARTKLVVVAAGACHSAAVAEDGRLWTWGRGAKGQLGIQLTCFPGTKVQMLTQKALRCAARLG
jgi:alpha-tubulin suppressor-like RCC1 family protein